MTSDRRAVVVVPPVAAVAAGHKRIDRAIPSKVPTRLLTSLLRLLQAMAQIHMLSVSPLYLVLRLIVFTPINKRC